MIILLGMPGSGKTTQTERLAGHLKCPWFSMGEIIRQNSSGKDRQEMLQGKIIPDKPTLKLLWDEIKNLDLVNKECVVEGNPRTIPQAEWWIDKVAKGQMKITGMVHLVITVEDAEQRLAQRHRVDDNDLKVMKERFAEYHRKVGPTVEFLKSHGLRVHQINAAQSIEKVESDIQKALNLN